MVHTIGITNVPMRQFDAEQQHLDWHVQRLESLLRYLEEQNETEDMEDLAHGLR